MKSLYFIVLIYMDQEDSLHHLNLASLFRVFFLSRKVAGCNLAKAVMLQYLHGWRLD